MRRLLHLVFLGGGIGSVFGASVGLYLYLQHHHYLPDYLCITPRERHDDNVSAPSNARSVMTWSVRDTAERLEKEAIIELRDADGMPVGGAEIEVGFDMPSMPMMHAIPNSVAQPTGQEGVYKVRFRLDMAGVWVAKINVKRPDGFRTTKRFEVE